MFIFLNNFRAVFWIAVVPAVISVFLLIFGVKEPKDKIIKSQGNPVSLANLKKMGAEYRYILIIGGMLSLARFSEAFLVLRVKDAGVSLAAVPLVMCFMNVIYSAAAYPFGKFSDRFSHKKLLAVGVTSLFFSNTCFAAGSGFWFMISGICLWAIHLSVTQGLLAVMIAQTAPQELKGTAFGFFNLVSGLGMLAASLTAGYLWQSFGAAFTFFFGAFITFLTLLLIFARHGQLKN